MQADCLLEQLAMRKILQHLGKIYCEPGLMNCYVASRNKIRRQRMGNK